MQPDRCLKRELGATMTQVSPWNDAIRQATDEVPGAEVKRGLRLESRVVPQVGNCDIRRNMPTYQPTVSNELLVQIDYAERMHNFVCL
jgi:hypothetical protein